MIIRRRVLALVLGMAWIGMALFRADAAVSREQSVADLAKEIAAISGPGPAKLTMRNQSSLSAEELPAIRGLLEQDLRGYGVTISGADTATAIRVTLSENTAGGLWIAEVQEGTEIRVAMLPVTLGPAIETQTGSGITLRKTLVWRQEEPVLDLLASQTGADRKIIVLESEHIVSYAMMAGAWTKEQEFAIPHARPFPRDMRGRLITAQGRSFHAYLPGVVCAGAVSDNPLSVSCADSDDPWPLPEAGGLLSLPQAFSIGTGEVQQNAFYNMARNYFTGLLTPGLGMQLQPFYNAAAILRPNGVAMLFNGIDGRVVLVENRVTKPIAGTRDWGSDFVAIHSACRSGVQVLVSGSGAAPTDSVRAYEIPGREAEPVSAPLEMDGQVMAMWPSNDNTGATVIVRAASGQMPYEVYSVSALCN
jgi:hypothetical protein